MTQHTASRKSSLSLNLRYMAMQIPYWMGFSILSSFASVFLLSRHLSDGQIGVVLADHIIVADGDFVSWLTGACGLPSPSLQPFWLLSWC